MLTKTAAPGPRNNLRELIDAKSERDKKDYNIRQVSILTGVSRQTVYAWLANDVKKFDRHTIKSFCDFLGVSIGELITYTPVTDEQ